MRLPARTPFPFYTGTDDIEVTVPISEVPDRFNVAINGRPYMLDQDNQQWGHQSIARTRQQADSSQLPSERSLNPEGLWRHSAESWHKGAGQRFLNLDDSDPARFRASKGIDPWTIGQLSLLPATDQKRFSGNTNLDLVVANDRCYLLDGDHLVYTSDITPPTPTFTVTTGAVLSSPTAITSDGAYVYLIDATNTYYSAVTGATYTAAGTSVGGTMLRYCKGRIMHADGNVWSELSGTVGSMTLTEIFTHPNGDFTFVDFTSSPSSDHIYTAGYSGDKSIIYRTELLEDGTGLGAAIVAAELPDGEIVRGLGSYLDFVFIGTDAGVHFAAPGQSGGLTVGGLITTGQPVHCFEGQDRFVWFGWTDYDTDSTGLGRLDLSVLNGSIPGYASDLMATGSGVVADVVTFEGRRVFSVAGVGVFAEDDKKVIVGTIDSGQFSYGLTEPKTAIFLDTQWNRGAGAFQRYFAVDGDEMETVGATLVTSAGRGGDDTVGLSQQLGRLFETRYEMFRSTDDATSGPILTRSTTHAQQAARPGVIRTVPLLLHQQVVTVMDDIEKVDVDLERTLLEQIHAETRVVLFQEGNMTYTSVLIEWQWQPHHQSDGNEVGITDGTFLAFLKDIE